MKNDGTINHASEICSFTIYNSTKGMSYARSDSMMTRMGMNDNTNNNIIKMTKGIFVNNKSVTIRMVARPNLLVCHLN